MLGDQRRGGFKNGVAHLAAVRLDGVVPEFRNHARIRVLNLETVYFLCRHCVSRGATVEWRSAHSTVLEDTHMATPAPSTNAPGETDARASGGSSSVYPGTPRWVKVSGIIALILIVLVVVLLLLGGQHSPMRHIPSGSGRTNTPPIAAGI